MTITDLIELLSTKQNVTMMVATISVFYFLKSLQSTKKKASEKRHKYNVKQSKKVLAKLQTLECLPSLFSYMRLVDPYVFEETVLTAFEQNGYKIKRGKSYSSDGGKDGEIFIDGELIYIQTKRYQSHISSNHVQEFNELCRKNKVKGIFVHTGRTGKKSKVEQGTDIDILSGQRLIDLIKGQGFVTGWAK